MMKTTLMKYLGLTLILIVFLYSFLAVMTYQNIQLQIVKLQQLEEQYDKREAQGEVPSKLRQDYERQYNTYQRQLSRVQSFWMKWIFDFPEFRSPS